MKTLTIAMIALCLSGSVFAMEGKVTLESGTASAKKNLHGESITPEETITTWNSAVRPPDQSSGSSSAIDWSKMPAGSHCGNFINYSTSVSQSCMGYYFSCPSGFTLSIFFVANHDNAKNIGSCIKN